jgi:hypothetical protein
MKYVAGLLASAALLAAAPAGARPTDQELFCHDLKRVIEAEDEYGFITQ